MSKIPGVALTLAAAGLSLTACGASGDQIASNCHAGLETWVLNQGFRPDFEYEATSVTKDTDEGGYNVDGFAWSQNATTRIAFHCEMDYDGEYVSSQFDVT